MTAKMLDANKSAGFAFASFVPAYGCLVGKLISATNAS